MRAPALAPLVLGQIGICLALATIGHPALDRRRLPASKRATALAPATRGP